MRILVAGFGNHLRQDDGFGIDLLRKLERHPRLPSGVELLEAGIGGISLVQELMTGYDALVVLDALEDGEPGEIKTLELEVRDPKERPPSVHRDTFADIHYAEPGRALALAKAVEALPEKTYMIGCTPSSCDLGQGLTPPVRAALELAAEATLQLLDKIALTTCP